MSNRVERRDKVMKKEEKVNCLYKMLASSCIDKEEKKSIRSPEDMPKKLMA